MNQALILALTGGASYLNGMDRYVNSSMAPGQWKLWTADNHGGTDQVAVTASLAAGVMTVTAAAANSIGRGHFLTGGAAAVDTRVVQQLTGTPGGVGTYSVSGAQTLASSTLSIGAKLPRTRANFDGGNLWTSDAAVGQNVSAGGGVSANLVIGFSAHIVNKFDGAVMFRAGGHAGGLDGSVYIANVFSGPGATYRMLSASGKVQAAVDPWPAWFLPGTALSGLATYTAFSATGAAGSSAITVADATGLTAAPDSWVGGNAAVPQGTYIASISGTNLTLSQPLLASISSSNVIYIRGAYNAYLNRDGARMPHAFQHYFGNVPMPGSSQVLCSGAYHGGMNYTGLLGGAWVIDPSLEGVSAPVLGPLQMAANISGQNAALNACVGYAQIGGSGFMGALAGSDVTGKMYCCGRGVTDQRVTLWRYETPTTTPTVVAIADAVYLFEPPKCYVTNAVVAPDPKVGGSSRMFFMDIPNNTTPNFAIYSDIESATPGIAYLMTWPTRPAFSATASGARAFSYCWNKDRQVMACYTGDKLFEFSLSWNGSTYVSSDWVEVTAAATGDAPSVVHSENNLMRCEYFPAPYRCYVVTNQQHEVRVLRRG